MGEWIYRSTFSLSRHLLELSDQIHASAALSQWEKPPVPIGYEARRSSEPLRKIWRRENSLPYQDTNSDPSVVQSVANLYTDCTTRLYNIVIRQENKPVYTRSAFSQLLRISYYTLHSNYVI
jgi:hypothetical protein